MSSRQYDELKRRVDELRVQFVDFDVPIDRDPTRQELSNIAAFKLLAHAEIQTYVEDRISECLGQSFQMWQQDRKVSRCLLGLVLRWAGPIAERDHFSTSHNGPSVDELMNRCLSSARDEISSNNSIKREAFSRLASSAGFLAQELDGTLLAELESFGKTRGELAHKAVGKVRVLNAPSVEAQAAKNIVELLEQFDVELTDRLGAG